LRKKKKIAEKKKIPDACGWQEGIGRRVANIFDMVHVFSHEERNDDQGYLKILLVGSIRVAQGDEALIRNNIFQYKEHGNIS
jgi:hypothetical protein